MDGQEIPIIWKYIFNLETRIDKLEKILAIDANAERSRDKAESDTQELTESELAKVLDNLVPSPIIEKGSLLDKSWEKSTKVKDITPAKVIKKAKKTLEKNQKKQE